MILKDAREFYYFYSGKTSDIARQLALAGIAVIWIFKTDVHGDPKLPEALLTPLVLIVIGLAIDLLQYAYATVAWGTYSRHKEKSGIAADTDFVAPPSLNWPTLACFVVKAVVIGAAYALLARYVAGTIVYV